DGQTQDTADRKRSGMIRSIGPVYAQNLVRGFGEAVRYHRRGVAAPVLRQPIDKLDFGADLEPCP
ncbi:MAG: hypothetical protein LGL72_18590, partial [Acidibrevibacterium sp.]|nr:hypothetical protein [Acidibrevibacterium fodinaquatile]